MRRMRHRHADHSDSWRVRLRLLFATKSRAEAWQSWTENLNLCLTTTMNEILIGFRPAGFGPLVSAPDQNRRLRSSNDFCFTCKSRHLRSYEYAQKNGPDDITCRGHSRSSGRVPPASLQIIGVADYRIRSGPDHDDIPRDARVMGQLFILILNASYRSQAAQITF